MLHLWLHFPCLRPTNLLASPKASQGSISGADWGAGKQKPALYLANGGLRTEVLIPHESSFGK